MRVDRRLAQAVPAALPPRATTRIMPQYVVAARSTRADQGPQDASSCTEVGQNQMWACQYYTLARAAHLGLLGRPGHDGLRPAGGDRRAGRPARRARHRHRRRRLDPDEQPGAGHRQASTTCRSRSSSSTTATSAWCGSGRSCSTASATPSTCSPQDCPDFVKLAEAYGWLGAAGHRRPPSSTRRSTRRSTTTARRSSTAASSARSACSRWSRPAARSTRCSAACPGAPGVRDARRRPARGGVGVDEAHTFSARREQAGRAHARHVAVRAARLQHRLARGRARPRTRRCRASRSW